MRVVISAETFLPRMNGVVNSVIQVARYLRDQGVPVLIIAPDLAGPREFEGIPVERVRSVTLPGVHDFDVSVATHARVARIMEAFQPTVVHLASPFVLGARVAATASAMGIPSVAVFQTDIAGYAQHYGMAPLAFIADAVIKKIHGSAAINLVPSTACEAYLTGLGVHNVQSCAAITGVAQAMECRGPHRGGLPRTPCAGEERAFARHGRCQARHARGHRG